MGSIARGSGFWWRHKGYGCEKRLSGLGLVVKGLVEFQKVYFSHLYILDIDVYIFRCRNLCFSFVYIPICLFIPLFYLFIIVFLFFLTQSLSWYWQKVQRNNDKLKKKRKETASDFRKMLHPRTSRTSRNVCCSTMLSFSHHIH